MTIPEHRRGCRLRHPEPPPAPPVPAPETLLDLWLQSTRHLVLVSTSRQEAWTASELPEDREIRATVNWLVEPAPYTPCSCHDFQVNGCTCDTKVFETWVAFVFEPAGSKFVYGHRLITQQTVADYVDAAIRRCIESDPC